MTPAPPMRRVEAWDPGAQWRGAYVPAWVTGGHLNDGFDTSTMHIPSHDIPLRVVVAGRPGTVSRAAAAAWVRRIVRAVSEVHALCSGQTGAPAECPSSLTLHLLLLGERKRLPEAPAAPIGVDNANTGVCVRSSNGACHILVYRREDALKTLLHELLHAFGVADWCDRDPVIRASARWWADRHRVPAGVELRPSEAFVDALAVRMLRDSFGMGAGPERACRRVYARALRHFAGGAPWAQQTHAFEYIVLRAVLLERAELLLGAFLGRMQTPDRRKARRALAARPEPQLPGPAAGLSLRVS